MLKIEQALVDSFIRCHFSLPIAHENADYTPTPGTPWVSLKVFQNQVSPTGIADQSDTTGVFQFSLYYPLGQGAIPAKSQAETIFAAYPLRTSITYSGQVVTITGQELFDAAPFDGWFRVVGRLEYRAYL